MKEKRRSELYVPKTENIELNSKNVKLRLIFAVILFIIAVIAITVGTMELLSADSGFRRIEAGIEMEGNIGTEIAFDYDLGSSGVSARAEYRKLSDVYKNAVMRATVAFTNRAFPNVFPDMSVGNLSTLNHNPNISVRVSEELYSALEMIVSYDAREVFLSPIYDYLNSLFFSENDVEAYEFDPLVNELTREYFNEVAAFARDENSIGIRLEKDNTAMLYVSDEYLRYAEENGIESYIDFGWMKNAFAVDYIAEELEKNGFTHGCLTSYDGYTRNLDDSGAYSYNIFDRVDNTVYPAARMDYKGRISLVCLRNYPMHEYDTGRYHMSVGGEMLHQYVSVRDGMCSSSLNNIIAYSDSLSCTDILLKIKDSFISDTFDENKPAEYMKEDIHTVFCDSFIIKYNDENITIAEPFEKNEVKYKTEFTG